MNILDQFSETKLTAEQEASLCKRRRFNDMCLATMREAVTYARTCSNQKIADDALISLCWEVLSKLAPRHDPNRGRFFAYAKQRLRGALSDYWTAQEPVRNAHTIPINPVPIKTGDAEIIGDPGFEDNINAPSQEPDFPLIDFHERFAEVSEVLAKNFTDRERALMQMVFSNNLTYAEAGKLFGISRAAAQAIASKVIDRVKELLENPGA